MTKQEITEETFWFQHLLSELLIYKIGNNKFCDYVKLKDNINVNN